MKKYILTGLLLLCGFINVIPAAAGTVSAGGEAWYVTWDSGLAKMNVNAVENQIKKELDAGVAGLPQFASYQGLSVDDPESKGFIFGPSLSYETDDKKWDLQASMMLFGSYKTDVNADVDVTGTFPIVGSITDSLPIKVSLDIDYKDFDFRGKRMLTDNFGVFAGTIYQSYKSTLDVDYDFTFQSSSMSSSLSFDLNAWMLMLYGGLSFQTPVGQMFTFNGNLGCGTPVAGKVKQNITISGTFFDDDITNNGGEVKTALMMFGEVSIKMKIAEKVSLDLGYQYRRLTVKVDKLDLNTDGKANESSTETDIFQGVTFAAAYMFNI